MLLLGDKGDDDEDDRILLKFFEKINLGSYGLKTVSNNDSRPISRHHIAADSTSLCG